MQSASAEKDKKIMNLEDKLQEVYQKLRFTWLQVAASSDHEQRNHLSYLQTTHIKERRPCYITTTACLQNFKYQIVTKMALTKQRN